MLLCGSLSEQYNKNQLFVGGCGRSLSDPSKPCPGCGYIFSAEFKLKFEEWSDNYTTKYTNEYFNSSTSKWTVEYLERYHKIPSHISNEILKYSRMKISIFDYSLALKQFTKYFYQQKIPNTIDMNKINMFNKININFLKFGDIIIFHEPVWKMKPPNYDVMMEVDENDPDYQDMLEDDRKSYAYAVDTGSTQLVGCWISNEHQDFDDDFGYDYFVIPKKITKHFDDCTVYFEFFNPKKQFKLEGIELKWNDKYLQKLCKYDKYEKYFCIIHPSQCEFCVTQYWFGTRLLVDFHDKNVEEHNFYVPYQCSWKDIAEYYEYEHKQSVNGETKRTTYPNLIGDQELRCEAIRKGEIDIEFRVLLRNETHTKYKLIPNKEYNVVKRLSPIWKQYTNSKIVNDPSLFVMIGPIDKLQVLKQQFRSLIGKQWFPHPFDDRVNWFVSQKWYFVTAVSLKSLNPDDIDTSLDNLKKCCLIIEQQNKLISSM